MKDVTDHCYINDCCTRIITATPLADDWNWDLEYCCDQDHVSNVMSWQAGFIDSINEMENEQ